MVHKTGPFLHLYTPPSHGAAGSLYTVNNYVCEAYRPASSSEELGARLKSVNLYNTSLYVYIYIKIHTQTNFHSSYVFATGAIGGWSGGGDGDSGDGGDGVVSERDRAYIVFSYSDHSLAGL